MSNADFMSFHKKGSTKSGFLCRQRFMVVYFKNEQYLLPFSHDEVVHGKATILQKMNGQYEDKFHQAKAMYLYMVVHPGKKLIWQH